MRAQVRVKKTFNIHDLFIGCVFLTLASFFVTSVINAKVVDNSIYTPQSIAGN